MTTYPEERKLARICGNIRNNIRPAEELGACCCCFFVCVAEPKLTEVTKEKMGGVLVLAERGKKAVEKA